MGLLGPTPPTVVEQFAKEPTTDLFNWIDALYTKAVPNGIPPTYMMHRFLASDREFAILARYLQLEVREPDLVFHAWQALLPRGRAPRFAYVAPKKRPEEEELVTRMKAALSESRETVETMIGIVQMSGREKDLYIEFGLTPPGTEAPTKRAVKQAPKASKDSSPKKGGLLAL